MTLLITEAENAIKPDRNGEITHKKTRGDVPHDVEKFFLQIQERENRDSIPQKYHLKMKSVFILRQIRINRRQIQKKFKHAADFGIDGSYSEANAVRFEQAIRKFMNNQSNKIVEGSYRGKKCIFHVNPITRLNVITDPDENFISGWKLSQQQLQIVLETAELGGI